MGGVGFPPPKLPQYPGHAGEESVHASPSLFLLVLDSPQRCSSAVLPRSVRPACMSAVPRPGVTLPNSVFPLLSAHVASSCALPSTQAPSPHRIPDTAPIPSTAPGSKGHILSSVARSPPPTELLPPGIGSRPYILSS